MIDTLKNRGILKLNAKINEEGVGVESSGAIAGRFQYTPNGHLLYVDAVDINYIDLLQDFSGILRSTLEAMFESSLYIYINENGFLTATLGNISYDKANRKAKFISEDEVDGNDESLMDLLIFTNFLNK